MKLFRRGVKAAAPPAAPEASVDVDTVRQRFNWEWAVDPDSFEDEDTYWWWACSIRVDPAEVIADDGEGNLWSVPFTTDGEDTVTFGEPVRVRQAFVPISATAGVAATELVTRRSQRVLADALERPNKPDPAASTAAVRPDNERNPMDDAVRQALARAHDLDPETATEDEVNAAVLAAAQQPDPEPEQEPAPAPAPEVTPVAASATDDGIRAALGLPASATADQVRNRISEIEAGARAGQEAHNEAVRVQRDQLVDAAVQDGRIPPSAREAWRQALDARPDAEAAALDALPAGRIPVRERGTSAASTTADPGYNRVRASMGLPARTKED